MNQLLIVGAMTVLIVIGFAYIVQAGANPAAAHPNGTAVNLPPIVDGKQDIYLKATQYGTYSPSRLKVKEGIPVRIHFTADLGAGCGHTIVFPEFGIQKNAPGNGEALIEFTPTRTGTFPFHCTMKMFNGTIEVVA